VANQAKRRRKLEISKADTVRTFGLVVLVAGIPILGTVIVTTSTTEPDLSELKPIIQSTGNRVFLDWSELLQDPSRLRRPRTAIPPGANAQALGYMMSNGSPSVEGGWVRDFILMPEAGNLMHPAHRYPDQMIAVHLRTDKGVQFRSRELVWVWGGLEVSPGIGTGPEALYELRDARAEPADKADIHRYFR